MASQFFEALFGGLAGGARSYAQGLRDQTERNERDKERKQRETNFLATLQQRQGISDRTFDQRQEKFDYDKRQDVLEFDASLTQGNLDRDFEAMERRNERIQLSFLNEIKLREIAVKEANAQSKSQGVTSGERLLAKDERQRTVLRLRTNALEKLREINPDKQVEYDDISSLRGYAGSEDFQERTGGIFNRTYTSDPGLLATLDTLQSVEGMGTSEFIEAQKKDVFFRGINQGAESKPLTDKEEEELKKLEALGLL